MLIAAIAFYGLLALGTVRILWIAQAPMALDVRRLKAPKLDIASELQLSNSSDVGVV